MTNKIMAIALSLMLSLSHTTCAMPFMPSYSAEIPGISDVLPAERVYELFGRLLPLLWDIAGKKISNVGEGVFSPGFDAGWNNMSMESSSALLKIVKVVFKTAAKKKGWKNSSLLKRRQEDFSYNGNTVRGKSVYNSDNKRIGRYGGDISDKAVNSGCAGHKCGGVRYSSQLGQDAEGTYYKTVAPEFKGKKYTLPEGIGDRYREESRKMLEKAVETRKNINTVDRITPKTAKKILKNWANTRVHHTPQKNVYQFVNKSEHEAARHEGGSSMWVK